MTESAALVDRVAEAIYESDRRSPGTAAYPGGRHNGAAWADLHPDQQAIYRRNAEAAIGAMTDA